MAFELKALLIAALILVLPILVQAVTTVLTQGIAWGLGTRDNAFDRSVLNGRATRAIANHLEAMAFFTPIVLVAYLAEVSTPFTQLGAALFAGGRLAFAVFYLLGVPVARTLVWTASTVGTFMIAWEVVNHGW